MGNTPTKLQATTKIHSEQHAARLGRQITRENTAARAERNSLVLHYTGVIVFMALAIAYGVFVLWYLGGK